MAEELSLVIRGAPGVEVGSADSRSEGRSMPLRKRLSGQNIVVSINQNCGPVSRSLPRGVDNGIATSRNYPHALQPDMLQMAGQPTGASSNVSGPLRLRTHTRKAQKFLEPGEELRTVGSGVLKSAARLHGSSRNCARVERWKALGQLARQ